MNKHLLSIMLVFLTLTGLAQYPVVTHKDVQEVSQVELANCNDESSLLGDTVIMRGIVMMDGDLAVPSGVGANPGHKNVWFIQGDGGPFKGLDIFALSSTNPTEDIHNLLEGDSIEVVGIIENYQGETEIFPLDGPSITLLGAGFPISYNTIPLSDLNDDQRNNNLETGEQWEGTAVTVEDVSVASVSFFSGGRVSFNVEDAQGNLANISDRFVVQRTPAAGGTFVAPTVGDQFDAISGVVLHSKNDCPGSNGRGYEIHPWKDEHYDYGSAAPKIFNTAKNPGVPTSSSNVTIQADIIDNDGVVTSAKVYWTTGASSTSFTQINMNLISGNTYEASIPAQPDGTLVKWYIEAVDDSALTNTLPNSNPSTETFLYRVRDNGLTIYDLQYTPFENGRSPFVDESVTVEGVVTASQSSTGKGDLGYVYIQQEGQSSYAGIWLRNAVTPGELGKLKRGDLVRVEGTVEESFGMTALSDIATATIIGTGNIDATVLNPDDFNTANDSIGEPFEGMLVRFENPVAGERLFITDTNADWSPGENNYAEYRIGTDQFTTIGSRVIAGRQTSSTPSSLWVSYVNSPFWETNSGNMNVPSHIVQHGESMTAVEGILYFGFSNYKLQPRNNDDFIGYSSPNFTVDFMTGADTACVLDSIQFMNMSSPFMDEFDWDFGGVSTATDENPMFAFNAAGTYTIEFTATNSADDSSATVSKTIEVIEGGNCGVGINDNEVAAELNVYPNPTEDVVTIETGFENGEIYTITIYDLQGREIMKRITRLATEQIWMNSFESGSYLMVVEGPQGETLQVRQLIKQ